MRPPEEFFGGRHELGEMILKTRKLLAFDPSVHKSDNIYWSRGKITASRRKSRNNYRSCVLWLTGLSGSGKSTIATELERELFDPGRHTCILDGDNVRQGLCSDLSFSPKVRTESIRRISEVARLFWGAGIICIAAVISPYRADRELARKMILNGRFVEVYVNGPIAVCEQHVPKGLYAKVRTGEIQNFTDVSAPYEAPVHPEIELHTDQLSVTEPVATILKFPDRQAVGAEDPMSATPSEA